MTSTRNTTPLGVMTDQNTGFIPKKKRKKVFLKHQKTIGGNYSKEKKQVFPYSNIQIPHHNEKRRRLTRPTLTGVLNFKFQRMNNKKDKTPTKIEMPKITEKKQTKGSRVFSFDSRPKKPQERVKFPSKSPAKTPILTSIQRKLERSSFLGKYSL